MKMRAQTRDGDGGSYIYIYTRENARVFRLSNRIFRLFQIFLYSIL